MTQQELQQFVSPFQVNKGFLLEGQEVPFELINSGPFDFLAFEMSCNCLGSPVLEPTKFSGLLVASTVGLAGSTYEMFKVGDSYAQIHHTAKGPVLYDPIQNKRFEGEVPDDLTSLPKVPVFKFHQSITLWFDDGEDFYQVMENKQLTINPNKNRLIVPISFMVIKKQ